MQNALRPDCGKNAIAGKTQINREGKRPERKGDERHGHYILCLMQLSGTLHVALSTETGDKSGG